MRFRGGTVQPSLKAQIHTLSLIFTNEGLVINSCSITIPRDVEKMPLTKS